eukprot:1835794-Rhodomonas_salina.3
MGCRYLRLNLPSAHEVAAAHSQTTSRSTRRPPPFSSSSPMDQSTSFEASVQSEPPENAPRGGTFSALYAARTSGSRQSESDWSLGPLSAWDRGPSRRPALFPYAPRSQRSTERPEASSHGGSLSLNHLHQQNQHQHHHHQQNRHQKRVHDDDDDDDDGDGWEPAAAHKRICELPLGLGSLSPRSFEAEACFFSLRVNVLVWLSDSDCSTKDVPTLACHALVC